MRVEGGGPGGDVLGNVDAVEAPPQPDDHRANAAIAHDQVGPDTHWENRKRGVKLAQEIGQIIRVGRLEQPIRRATHAQPCQAVERALRRKLPAYGDLVGSHGGGVAQVAGAVQKGLAGRVRQRRDALRAGSIWGKMKGVRPI